MDSALTRRPVRDALLSTAACLICASEGRQKYPTEHPTKISL
jgi:hypothetical protein